MDLHGHDRRSDPVAIDRIIASLKIVPSKMSDQQIFLAAVTKMVAINEQVQSQSLNEEQTMKLVCEMLTETEKKVLLAVMKEAAPTWLGKC